MNKIILSVVTLVLLSACTSPQEETKTTTVLDSKINTIKAAQASVDAVNARTKAISKQTYVHTASASGANLYSSKCASCHGSQAKKSALNASASIAGWSSSKIQTALMGYKTGNFGGKMKAIMEGQSKPLSKEEIKLLSDYISIL
ncbi:c-type cytochrome [Sulfurimonas sp. MAG313]|nr:c-type cytochrome [Sulfurimonas sp. MAG313]MDF1880347.1 c-type cytochrome [Sulfurimonas sp. MAG313]